MKQRGLVLMESPAQTLKSQANTSKSKQAYTVPKEERFKWIPAAKGGSGVIAYSGVSCFTPRQGKFGGSFGRAKRDHPADRKREGGDPGRYDVISCFSPKSVRPSSYRKTEPRIKPSTLIQ